MAVLVGHMQALLNMEFLSYEAGGRLMCGVALVGALLSLALEVAIRARGAVVRPVKIRVHPATIILPPYIIGE